MSYDGPTRRDCLKAAGAIGAAGLGGTAGCLGGGGGGSGGEKSWRKQDLAMVPAEEYDQLYTDEDDEKKKETLNHLTWTGYDASNVQDPFRKKFNCNTQI